MKRSIAPSKQLRLRIAFVVVGLFAVLVTSAFLVNLGSDPMPASLDAREEILSDLRLSRPLRFTGIERFSRELTTLRKDVDALAQAMDVQLNNEGLANEGANGSKTIRLASELAEALRNEGYIVIAPHEPTGGL